MIRTNGFWTSGRRQYLAGLRSEEREALSPLKDAIKSETDPEAKSHLKKNIKTIKSEFKVKRKEAHSGLFSRS